MRTVFLLSPANCSGKRARLLTRPDAASELAERLRTGGASIGETFAFVSALYFRGKLAYAEAFADARGILVITPSRGLVPAGTLVTTATLSEFAAVRIERDARYTQELERTAGELERAAGDARVVLLGSIATDKYAGILTAVFGERLLFPAEFVGRGDMSRGGLMLRAAEAGTPLEYIPLLGARRRGSRPPRLEKKKRHGRATNKVPETGTK
jgi:hypothetical protein